MNSRTRRILALTLVTSFVGVGAVHARRVFRNPRPTIPQFQLLDPPPAASAATAARQFPGLRGSPLSAIDGDALVLDEDSGELLRVSDDDVIVDRLAIGGAASQVVVDPLRRRAYVADRRGDQIVVVDLGANAPRRTPMKRTLAIKTLAEPFGLALSPDASRLLVTTVADAALSAYDTGDGTLRWSLALAPEPRGVAVSPDGTRAVVGFLSTGAAATIDLATTPPVLRYAALDDHLDASAGMQSAGFGGLMSKGGQFQQSAALGTVRVTRFARGAFATLFLGNDLALVAHQMSIPARGSERVESRGTYGGGGARDVPIENRLALLSAAGTDGGAGRKSSIELDVRQIRALAYDGQRDRLHVAGFGDDFLMSIGGIAGGAPRMLGVVKLPTAELGCGPTGLDVDPDGNLRVFCSFSRSLIRVTSATAAGAAPQLRAGIALTTSHLSPAEQRGRTLFRGDRNQALSSSGLLACSSCHPEGRADGLSWRIEGKTLQTPLLAGRLLGTHPFKWDGGDADLASSLRNTVKRLGGSGISAIQASDLAAFLTTLSRPRPPTVRDRGAVARGQALFQDETVGCAGCHEGAMLTDQLGHKLTADLPLVDTPSLVGLAASAPYYHDGSAPTLRALLLENGSIHEMGKVEALSLAQIDDLVSFLQTL